MKTIGLVLKGPISYSLTFIANEINVWQQLGFQVIVFSGREHKLMFEETSVRSVKGLPYKRISFADLGIILWVFAKVILFGLVPAFNFIRYERSVGSTFLQSFKKLYKIAHILSFKLDVVHFGFGSVAIDKEYLAKSLNATMSVSFRGADISILPLSKPNLYHKVWSNADKLHFISNDLYQEALKHGLIEINKVSVIYQTLDLDIIPIQRESWVIGEPIKILTVARLHWKKGLEYALAAIQHLAKEGIDCQYTIVGDGEHELALRYSIKDMGLEHKVHLTGALPYKDVLARIASTDLYIQSSIQEGFCNAVLEAQACAVLTIATNAEGLNENIIDGETGWIVPKRDVDALVGKIKQVLALSIADQQRIKWNARERVVKDFNLNRYAQQWWDFFIGVHADH